MVEEGGCQAPYDLPGSAPGYLHYFLSIYVASDLYLFHVLFLFCRTLLHRQLPMTTAQHHVLFNCSQII